jgi:hypothetical protein
MKGSLVHGVSWRLEYLALVLVCAAEEMEVIFKQFFIYSKGLLVHYGVGWSIWHQSLFMQQRQDGSHLQVVLHRKGILEHGVG